MIVDPPLLTIRAGFLRPAKETVEAFAGVPTGNIVDALGGSGALDYRIKPLALSGKVLVGVALTCDCGPADNLALFGALSVAQPGDILVAATGGYAGAAVTGDLMLGMARNLGVAGFVTDGMVRDIVGVLEVGLPVYCAGVTPNSPARNGPGTIGEPVNIGGMRVESGDILIGDRDGVVVVPRSLAATALKALENVRANEAALEAKVKNGLKLPDFARAILESGRVRIVD
jgi:4-hydroxy-4-methyl-2-oxoglutarate aldolase